MYARPPCYLTHATFPPRLDDELCRLKLRQHSPGYPNFIQFLAPCVHQVILADSHLCVQGAISKDSGNETP